MSKAATTATPPKKGKKTETEATVAAPRPRKWNYGIKPEAVIRILKKEEEVGTLKGDLNDDYKAMCASKTVEQYTAGGGTRHGLRLFMRRGILSLGIGKEVYPQPYEAPVKPEKPVKAPKAA